MEVRRRRNETSHFNDSEAGSTDGRGSEPVVRAMVLLLLEAAEPAGVAPVPNSNPLAAQVEAQVEAETVAAATSAALAVSSARSKASLPGTQPIHPEEEEVAGLRLRLRLLLAPTVSSDFLSVVLAAVALPGGLADALPCSRPGVQVPWDLLASLGGVLSLPDVSVVAAFPREPGSASGADPAAPALPSPTLDPVSGY